MMFLYKATIDSNFDNTIVQSMWNKLDKKILTDSVRDSALNYMYYFYQMAPLNPIVFWNINGTVVVEPGNNRLLGSSLRKSNLTLNCFYISSDSVDTNDVGWLQNFQFIEKIDLPFPDNEQHLKTSFNYSESYKRAVFRHYKLYIHDNFPSMLKSFINKRVKANYKISLCEGILYFGNRESDIIIDYTFDKSKTLQDNIIAFYESLK